MRKIAEFLFGLTGLLGCASVLAQAAAPEVAPKVLAASTAAIAPTGIPATIGELVRLEAQKALEEARKSAQAGAPVAPVPTLLSVAPPAGANTDVVELLGTYRRGDKFSADLAINGVVSFVQPGDSVGPYEVTGIAGNCIHLLDMKKTKLLRCNLAGSN